MTGAVIQGFDFGIAEQPHFFGGVAQPKFPLSDHLAWCDECTRANESVLFHHRAIQHDGTHANQNGIFNRAGVDDGLVADGDIAANPGGKAAALGVWAIVTDVYHRAILDIGAVANTDEIDIATHHRERPDGNIVPQHHVTDHGTHRIHENTLAKRGGNGAIRSNVHALDSSPRTTTLPRMENFIDTQPSELAPTLQRLRSNWQASKPDYAQRMDDLGRLRHALRLRMDEMAEAVGKDFSHRAKAETRIADGMTVLNDIDHLRKHLRKWMRPTRVGVGWRFLPARAQVRPMPLGVVGVIAPWNYPVNLALIPLATALAAGNHVYLKPSEHTPHTARFLRSLLAEAIAPGRVAVATGGADIGAAFAGLPFDHLVFTGSTAVGRKVMAAAAAHLTPLTLELGGKSPALIAEDYPIEHAAARIATGKWFNCGQTCIAPDYVLVPKGKRDALVKALRDEAVTRYGENLTNLDDYTRIINAGQYNRLKGYLDDAKSRGIERVTLAGHADPAQRLLPPTLLLDPSDDALIMQEEIFGPLLPIKSYRSLDEAIAYINAHDRPLALYPFSHNRATVEKILHGTLAGGVSVNDTLFHFAIGNLPFGGVGPSGMGAYHGRAGFDAMSKQLPVFWQARRSGGDLLKPPYSKAKWLIDLIVR